MNRKNGISKGTMRLALCSVIAALGTVIMMLTGLIPIGTYAFPTFAGMLLIAVVIEYGSLWALGVYAVVSVLSVFLSGDKEAVLYFIFLFGYYPILKAIIESKLRNTVLQYILKFAVFNIAAVASFYVATALLSLPAEDFVILGVYVPWVLLIVGNIFFIIYDFCLTVLVTRYVRTIRDKIFKIK